MRREGEFHTFVFDGPIFRRRIDFEVGETVLRDGFYYRNLIPVSDNQARTTSQRDNSLEGRSTLYGSDRGIEVIRKPDCPRENFGGKMESKFIWPNCGKECGSVVGYRRRLYAYRRRIKLTNGKIAVSNYLSDGDLLESEHLFYLCPICRKELAESEIEQGVYE